MTKGTIEELLGEELFAEDATEKKTFEDHFFIQFAYPTVSGAMHVGHLRSYVPPDIQARYRRLKGDKVFFPLGFHATGIDSIVLFDKIKENPNIIEDYKIPVDEIKGIQNVFQLEKLLERKITASMMDANLSLDYDAAVATLDPHYNRFIEWQMGKLLEKEFLVKKPYRLPWCNSCDNPVALDAAGADIIVPPNVEEIRIVDYNMIKFRSDDKIFPIATLRPETIFGVTNMFIHPTAKYVECEADGETWVLAEEAVEQIRDLGKEIKIKGTLNGSLDEMVVTNPINGEEIPFIYADFVSPKAGTGVVMSVPAHDPHDYIYTLKMRPDLEEKFRPVIEMDTQGIPAKVLINQMGGPERADLEAVKKRLYRMENKGVMNSDTGKYAGLGTEEARNMIKQDMEVGGHLEVISELSEHVNCRCGDRITIKSIPNQWFVDYSNPRWKELARECVDGMNIFPTNYKKELKDHIIGWLKERPLTRTTGLGTVFPYDPGLMIEALADSNVYMAFFPIARRVNKGEISAANLNDDFFDYVMLKEGSLEETVKKTGLEATFLDELQAEFDAIYPLDFNMGGMEHKQVHFPFSIFHHVGIFPKEKWQQGLIVNWHVILEGRKMSKSDGHVVFWNDALEEYGVDGSRLYIAHGQSPFDNFDWKGKMAGKYAGHVRRFPGYVERTLERTTIETGEQSDIDNWLVSRAHKHTKTIGEYLENAEVRWAVNNSFFVMQNDMKWYFQRGGNNQEVVEDFVKRQLTMLYPFIPETVDGLEAKYFAGEDLTANGMWPHYDEKLIDETNERLEEILIETRKKLNGRLHKKGKNQVGNYRELVLYVKSRPEIERFTDGIPTIKHSTGVETVTLKLASEVREEDFDTKKRYEKFSGVHYGEPEFQLVR